jgi:putative membrane protein
MWHNADFMFAGPGDGSWFADHGSWYWGMGLHGLTWILFVILAVAAIMLLVRSIARGGASTGAAGSVTSTGDSAAAILDARYARGEIERGEYLERKRDIS